MSKKILIYSVICLSPSVKAQSELIIWNVGQGSWATEVHSDLCIHYDLGGEKDPSPRVLQLCRRKENVLYLSHWDWDHISFVGKFTKSLKKVCLARKPDGKPSAFKKKVIDKVPVCPSKETGRFQKFVRKVFKPWKAKNSNDLSEILYSSRFQVLIPGDSSKAQEKYWRDQAPSRTRGLILGHHGSSTSTSKQLLENLPRLQWAVASARRQRYGHPHWKVTDLLERRRIPLLKTEDWGHLHFVRE